MNSGVIPRPQEEAVEVPLEEIQHLLEGVPLDDDTDDGTDDDGSSTVADILTGHPSVAAEDIPLTQLPDHDTLADTLDQLRQVLPDDHPDIHNLELAIKRLEDAEQYDAQGVVQDAYTPDSHDYDPIHEAEAIFSQQIQMADMPDATSIAESGSPFEMVDDNVPQELEEIAENAMLPGTPEQAMVEDMMAEMGIETVGLNTGPTDSDVSEINQAIDEASGLPQDPEEDPWLAMQNAYGLDLPTPYPDPSALASPFGPPIGPTPGP